MARFSILPASAIVDSRLTLRELSVLAAIGIHTDRNGWCFPSSERLGEMLGIRGPMVRKSIAALASYGYLEVRERFRDDGSQTSNAIRVLMDTEHQSQHMRCNLKASSDAHHPVPPEGTPPVPLAGTPPAPPEGTLKLPFNDPIEGKSKSTERVPRSVARFEDFWRVYPNKKGKADAQKAWAKKGLDAQADSIIGDVMFRAKNDRDWLRGYVPHGSTYVNAEGWQDGLPPPIQPDVKPQLPNKQVQAMHAIMGIPYEAEQPARVVLDVNPHRPPIDLLAEPAKLAFGGNDRGDSGDLD